MPKTQRNKVPGQYLLTAETVRRVKYQAADEGTHPNAVVERILSAHFARVDKKTAKPKRQAQPQTA